MIAISAAGSGGPVLARSALRTSTPARLQPLDKAIVDVDPDVTRDATAEIAPVERGRAAAELEHG